MKLQTYMEGNKKPVVALNDRERYPLLSDLSLLNTMKQDEFAPIFNFQSGDRLNKEMLASVHDYAQKIRGKKMFWEKETPPGWLENYFSWCKSTVPIYQSRKGSFLDQPTINRGDISKVPWDFVSTDSILQDLLVYQTSGTTGAAMDVLFDPVSQACWLPQLQSVLDLHDIKFEPSPDQVAIALICSQSSTLTYASLSTYFGGAGVLKVNLNPADWKDPSHRLKFLEKYNPLILTGDPFAFSDLLDLKPTITPKALVSSAMKLTDGLKKKLEDYFNCLVLDIYSLTECRMVAFAENQRHRAIRPELYLEVFDKERDILLPYGERGELVITGGTNPFLPLVRYRTGDFCSLEIENGIPYLIDFEAREPVPFFTKSGKLVNNIEISRALMDFPLAGFKLHQKSNYDLDFEGWSSEDVLMKVREGLERVFGNDALIEVAIKSPVKNKGYKTVTYTSEWTKLF